MTPDVFAGDAFSMHTLTAAINRLPHVPSRLSRMGLFQNGGVTTTKVWIEENAGELELLQTSVRGAPAQRQLRDKRKAREFEIPHITLESSVFADELQDVRQFGTESQGETTQYVLNQHLQKMQRRHEATLEHLRVGALKGEILDSDGSIVYDLFDEFGVAQQTQSFEFSNSATKVRNTCLSVARDIEEELGQTPVTGLRGLCGRDFFDALISHPDVERAYERFQAGEMLRNDPRAAFPFGEIQFEEYRGRVGGQPFIEPDACYIFPEGTDLFITRFAPADFVDTANTLGLPMYARSEMGEMQRYVTLHTQSNPLPLVLKPRCVVKATAS